MKSYMSINTFPEWKPADQLEYTVRVIKGLIMDGVRKANSGHTGGAFSSADFAAILFKDFLKTSPDDPNWIGRDRFILSAGHESMLLYSLLCLTGILPLEELKKFRQLNSQTPGHPEIEYPGVEATTGPLGQGVAMAVGTALAEVKIRSIFGELCDNADEIFGHFTYVLAGDGDLQEPVTLGAAALAGHWGLSKLIMYYDSNQVQISGTTFRSDSTDITKVFDGFGWHIQKIDGHDSEEIKNAIKNAQLENRPSLIIGATTMAHGTATQEGNPNTHGSPLTEEEIQATKEKLGLSPDSFWLPAEVVNYFQQRQVSQRDEFQDWKNKLTAAMKNNQFKSYWENIYEQDFSNITYPEFDDQESIATRKAFGTVLDHFAEQLPALLGGSADLEPSNYTGNFALKYGDFQRDNINGRNLAFGVREFPMAAIMNGIAIHGDMIPFGGTFLVFSDYSRPAIRLGALQQLRVIHEFTHDSFYVGEDGPTHQPVEHIMSLRNIPNLNVYRPGDAKETAVCFKMALKQKNTPSALILSRQGLPVLDEDISSIEKKVMQGGYIVLDTGSKPEIIIIATGSEVSLALSAAKKLTDKNVRVVSLPCWEIFQSQPEKYKESVLPRRGCVKVSLEAGITLGWERFTGANGFSIGLDSFGMSAPAGELAEKFGFTPDKVVKKIRDHIHSLL